MNLRVMSWNAEGMFVEGSMTRRASPDDALAVLREVGADIVVVPEFGVFERMSEKTSSAIAARLALGEPVPLAAERAQAYVARTLAAAFHPGRGAAIPRRLGDGNAESGR